MRFTKMHGLGNDYIFIDSVGENLSRCNIESLANIARCLSDRKYGVGGDGIVLYENKGENRLNMRIFNSDGSEAEICGNALRCLALLAVLTKKVNINDYRASFQSTVLNDFFNSCLDEYIDLIINTNVGEKDCRLFLSDSNSTSSVLVNMGKSGIVKAIGGNTGNNKYKTSHIDDKQYETLEICNTKCETSNIVDEKYETLQIGDKCYEYIPINMGNPHAVFFVADELTDEEFYFVAPKIEKNEKFQDGVNVEFVKIIDKSRVKMRVWERGSGETSACGSGACAVAKACVVMGKTKNIVYVECEGGELTIFCGEEIYMFGEATRVFEGETTIPPM